MQIETAANSSMSNNDISNLIQNAAKDAYGQNLTSSSGINKNFFMYY